MKNYKIIFLLLLCFISIIKTKAELASYFEHYSTDDGLPQYTIMDIIQDHKGFMWFATWDGFSKFDGTTFRNYKVQSGDTYYMKSNRIQRIYEDKYGYMWLKSYDNEAHRFEPRTETFKGIQSIPEYEDYPFLLSDIKIMSSGRVWLLSEYTGCFGITDSLFSVQLYNKEKGRLKGNAVYNVFEDSSLNSWLLTDNGLCLITDGQYETKPFFFENKNGNGNQAFFSAIENGDEIWFGSNYGRIWKYSKKNEKFDLFDLGIKSNITGFQKVSDNKLIIMTSADGFFIYELPENKITLYSTTNTSTLKDGNIQPVFFDSHKQFWFHTNELGVYKFNTQTNELKYFFVKAEDVAVSAFPPFAWIQEDIHGQIWVHPKGGGFSRYNIEKDLLEPFYDQNASPGGRFSNILHSLYSDKQGNLWFSTRSHGLEKVTFENIHFNAVNVNLNTNSPTANDVRAVFQDNENRIWVSTKDRHLTIYDESYNRLGYLNNDGAVSEKGFFNGVIYCMMQDKEGNIWLGTKGDGLYKVSKTANELRFKIEQFTKDPNDIYSISEDVIYNIFQDSKGNIWVGTYGNGLNLLKTTDDGKTIFISHRNHLKNYPIETGYRIRYISENKYGNICIGTTAGLFMFSSDFSSPDEINYTHYTRIPGDKGSLGNNDIHGICNTASGEMFLATFGGGLNKVVEYDSEGFPLKFHSYTMNDGMPMDVCLAVLEDENGKLWISMENNLTRFDPEKETFETFSEIKRLMSTSNFSEASACKLSNNDLIIGYSNGFLCFSPKEIQNSKFAPYIALSDFRLFSQLVTIGDKESPLPMNIDDMDKLVLKRKQNFFSIEYAALDFALNDNILYAYKLDGVDNDWSYVQKQRIANYTNIPKGDYVFRVKSTNSEGVWVDNERVLPIKILPSFWETPWAIIMYIVLFLALIYISVRILFTFYRLRNNVVVEKQISEMKLRFFTDISHEIRTPLTMISAPVDYMLNEEDTPEKVKKQLNLISQNTNRLLRLVNQILDFRKVQQIKMKIQETNLGMLVENICHNFDDIARKNNINYVFRNEAKDKTVWADRDALEKIVMNLLSNAFKYTPHDKLIQVIVKDNEKEITVEVKDEGFGISKEKQKSLFTRFASFNEDKSKPSTGIGLFIIKELVGKHGGKITMESELGKGSTFTVSFPHGLNHFDENVEIIPNNQQEKITKEEIDKSENIEDVPSNESNEKKNQKKSVLIVEDDADLRGFIKTILEKEYDIIEAEDGVEGFEKAEKANPDFIVSDIMMPRMDGIELLQKLRENVNTSHIPIILLTAKTTIESKLEGLSYGADDYITKPFNVPYFRARINNLLEQRKHLQALYRSQFTSSASIEFAPQPFIITSQDESMMKKVVEAIEKNMDNSDFTVEELSSAAGMSRSVFFNKVKSLTGLAPVEFIRDIKLKRAAQLLSSGEFMVKEVSYMIGISDTKYFGKIFKTKYGMTPQEYKNENNTEK